MRVTRLENGPPVGYPVQMRISGEHIERVQAIARQVEAKRTEQGGAAGDRPGACPRAGREQCPGQPVPVQFTGRAIGERVPRRQPPDRDAAARPGR
ncbi:hypothetical protein G6F64_015378 [Rhizopus arrhizus]|uniref:Uncharacterized protein n=1 Tax=Rhizopus oryzae TaxID=64495 RepID=A0A9P7BIW6_RHIOR|nr:hypothetical protein G6F64_015378 [Rhizopus arrhizus]